MGQEENRMGRNRVINPFVRESLDLRRSSAPAGNRQVRERDVRLEPIRPAIINSILDHFN